MWALILTLTINGHSDTYVIDHNMSLGDCNSSLGLHVYQARHRSTRIQLDYACVRQKDLKA